MNVITAAVFFVNFVNFVNRHGASGKWQSHCLPSMCIWIFYTH